MKSSIGGIAMSALLAIFILSCDDKETGITPTEVQFATLTQQVAENAAEETVVLQFSRPVSGAATLSIKAASGFSGVLTTEPAMEDGVINVAIVKGDASAQIKIKPVNNTLADGHKTIEFAIHHLPEGFTAGVRKALALKITDDETAAQESVANFIEQDITLEETSSTGVQYEIHLSEKPVAGSLVKVSLVSDKAVYNQHYVTEPAAADGIITLTVNEGEQVIAFRAKPVNNSEITGDLDINFTITETAGSIRKGTRLEQTLTIRDEELAGKPKGYELTAGSTVVKRFYEYDAHGRIAKINWEHYTPYYSHGTETYYYDANGNVEKINVHPFKDIVYQWSDGRIVRSEEISAGVVKAYTEYEYDEAGNVGGVFSWYRQENGEFLKGLYTIYLYYQDGNLFKSLTYNDGDNPEEPQLIRTRTYEDYIDVSNPFPMAEVLPGINMQPKLAMSYRVEEYGVDMTYALVYEYRADGLPGKRIATATGDVQTAVYHYY